MKCRSSEADKACVGGVDAAASGFGLEDSEVTGVNATDNSCCTVVSEMLSKILAEVSCDFDKAGLDYPVDASRRVYMLLLCRLKHRVGMLVASLLRVFGLMLLFCYRVSSIWMLMMRSRSLR